MSDSETPTKEPLAGRISGEVIKVFSTSVPIDPESKVDKRNKISYYLDEEGARKIVFNFNDGGHKNLATFGWHTAIRLDDGRHILVDRHEQLITISSLPVNT